MINSVFVAANHCLAANNVEEKLRLSNTIVTAWKSGNLSLLADASAEPIGEPGRPERPPLVPPRELVRRRINTPTGRAALIHAIAHIEFNAINLAWDAVYRFRDMPKAYYGDWLQVVAEEAHHFSLLRARLQELGYDYGDFPAHNGLWEMACKTAADPLLRMALVPRVLEARGLDVTPGMIARLKQVGDDETVAILDIILRDEIGHVAIGSRWFHYLCAQRGLEPETTFQALVQEYMDGPLHGPFNDAARLQAGFSVTELATLHARDQEVGG